MTSTVFTLSADISYVTSTYPGELPKFGTVIPSFLSFFQSSGFPHIFSKFLEITNDRSDTCFSHSPNYPKKNSSGSVFENTTVIEVPNLLFSSSTMALHKFKDVIKD